jgi:hypothetical protein
MTDRPYTRITRLNPTDSADGVERGRDPRLAGFWLVEVWLHEDVFASGSVVDVGSQGLCVKTSETAGNVMRRGELCRLKIHTEAGVVVCTGEIRSIDPQGIRFEVREGLPPRPAPTNAAPDRLPQ